MDRKPASRRRFERDRRGKKSSLACTSFVREQQDLRASQYFEMCYQCAEALSSGVDKRSRTLYASSGQSGEEAVQP